MSPVASTMTNVYLGRRPWGIQLPDQAKMFLPHNTIPALTLAEDPWASTPWPCNQSQHWSRAAVLASNILREGTWATREFATLLTGANPAVSTRSPATTQERLGSTAGTRARLPNADSRVSDHQLQV